MKELRPWGEHPDHYTELERRLIHNLRTCQARSSRYEARIGSLYDALELCLDELESLVGVIPHWIWDQGNVAEALMVGREAIRREQDS